MSKSYITFVLGQQVFGVALQKIREILTYTGFTQIPDTKEWVVGVVNSRDKAMPIVDLRIRFGNTKEPIYDDKTVIIATKIEGGELLGFIVDEIKDIEEISEDEILKASNINSVVPAKYLDGYIKRGNKMIVLLDNEKIIDRADLKWN